MAGTRQHHPAAFQARVALEAAKQTKTVAELAKAYQVHPVQMRPGFMDLTAVIDW